MKPYRPEKTEGMEYQCYLLAQLAHDGQTRWDGTPYIEHPAEVARSLDGENLKCVAWLHDAIEDSGGTIEELRAIAGISEEVCDAVDAMTHREGETYAKYIERLSNNNLACLVKLADLEHNLSDLEPGQRRDKYELAQIYIKLSIYTRAFTAAPPIILHGDKSP